MGIVFTCQQEEPGCICRCRACNPCWPAQHCRHPSEKHQSTGHASPKQKKGVIKNLQFQNNIYFRLGFDLVYTIY